MIHVENGDASVQVVIVTYNNARQIADCLRSLQRQQYSGWLLEVTIVDNRSTDATLAVIAETMPEANIVALDSNVGFAGAVNRGGGESESDWILLVNPDTVLAADALLALAQSVRDGSGFDITGGRIVTHDGSTDPSSCWGFPSLWSTAMFASGLSTFAARNAWLDPESLGGWDRDTAREVPVVTGCLLLINRKHWDLLGGLDSMFFLYGDDLDLALRAKRAGLSRGICPEARLAHEAGGSSSSDGVKMCRILAGRVTFMNKHWARPAAWLGRTGLAIGCGLRAVGERSTRQGRGQWTVAWRDRRLWEKGYPAAVQLLF